jgi:hypothetical protein
MAGAARRGTTNGSGVATLGVLPVTYYGFNSAWTGGSTIVYTVTVTAPSRSATITG